MNKLSNIYRIRISDIQKQTLDKLEKYNVNVPSFIRAAIKEKIQRDYPKITKEKIDLTIPEWAR